LRQVCDASAPTRRPRREHLGARKAQMREGFIVSEEIDYFDLFSLAWVRSFQGRKELVHGNVDLDNFEFLSQRRSVADFIGRL
jgi:hypothetical protein